MIDLSDANVARKVVELKNLYFRTGNGEPWSVQCTARADEDKVWRRLAYEALKLEEAGKVLSLAAIEARIPAARIVGSPDPSVVRSFLRSKGQTT